MELAARCRGCPSALAAVGEQLLAQLRGQHCLPSVFLRAGSRCRMGRVEWEDAGAFSEAFAKQVTGISA